MTNGRLGKGPRVHDPRTLRLANFLAPALSPPASADWLSKVPYWGMLKNDVLGDCTIAAVGHADQTWSANTGKESVVTDDVVVQYYSTWDGYVQGDPETDQGGIELNVLKDWQQQGFNGCALTAFAEVNPRNLNHVKAAIALFGGIYIGVELPITAQNQAVWSIDKNANTNDSTPGSWGGHALWLPAYDVDTLTCITWGAPKKMTLEWFLLYCSEAYVLFSPTWINGENKAPSGVDYSALQLALTEVQN